MNQYFKDYFSGEIFCLPYESKEKKSTFVSISVEEYTQTAAKNEQIRRDGLTYAQRRAEDYPSIPDQLDIIFHSGLDAWKAAIQSVKDKNPKPT